MISEALPAHLHNDRRFFRKYRDRAWHPTKSRKLPEESPFRQSDYIAGLDYCWNVLKKRASSAVIGNIHIPMLITLGIAFLRYICIAKNAFSGAAAHLASPPLTSQVVPLVYRESAL